MSWNDDILTWIAPKIEQTINNALGYVVSPERWNELWNLLIMQGDNTAGFVDTLVQELDTLVFSATDAGSNITIDVAGIVATTVSGALAELYSSLTALSDLHTALDATVTADIAALATHKTSSDHDTRYYTETEVDAIQAALQGQLNTNLATLASLQNQLDVLDETYSTDAERAAAVAAVIAAFELADDDLEALIVGKADAANVYTKAEIDAMTMGSYKFASYQETGAVTAGGTYVATTTEYNAENDMVIVAVGGLFQQIGTDFTLDTATKTFTGLTDQWVEGYQIDLWIIKNFRVVLGEDYYDGTMIQTGTVAREAIDAAFESDIAGLESDVATAQSTADSKAEITKGTATLLAAGWVAGTGDYALQQDVAITGILATDWVDALPSSQDDIDVAQDAEVASIVTEYAGGIRFYAQTATASDITIRYKVVR